MALFGKKDDAAQDDNQKKGAMGQMKDLYKIQKEAKSVKKELKNLHIEAEVSGIVVTINGEQEVVEVKIPEEMTDKAAMQKALIEAFNKAIKKSQQIAADKMKGVMSGLGLNLPGM